jgi:hypothetical protein
MGTTQLLTIEEFALLPEGELIVSPSAKARHTDVVLQIFTALSRILNGSEFIARSEAGSALKRTDPASVPQPDVLIVEKARWDRAVQLNDWLEGRRLSPSRSSHPAIGQRKCARRSICT